MTENGYEKLPEDTTETCDRAEEPDLLSGYYTGNKTDPYRCGKKAAWINRSRCGCGACDMTTRECDSHYQKRTAEETARRQKFDAEFEIVETKLPGGLVRYSKRRKGGTNTE